MSYRQLSPPEPRTRSVLEVAVASLCVAACSGPARDSGSVSEPTHSGDWSAMEMSDIGAAAIAAAWTGERFLVWGGYATSCDDSIWCRRGGSYDPLSDQWTPISVEGAPSVREHPAGVWAEQLLFIWGGSSSDGSAGWTPLGDGGAYHPEGDFWTTVAEDGAPEARQNATALWTGEEVLLWGGDDAVLPAGLKYGDGAAYNPATDSWRPISSEGAPSPRFLHTAVWTGEEMIVWGGWGEAALGDGSAYEPGTDTWRPISNEGAPSVRINHTAVWTGDEMIVWGGEALDTVAGGGAYDPETDAWRPLPPGGGAARAKHVAVWTGSEMVVWGGTTDRSGAAYDPIADQWSTLPSENAPAPRHLAVAVWTGTSMVVWGGVGANDDAEPLRSGGVYTP